MGADGGSIPKHSELVAKPINTRESLPVNFRQCHLTGDELEDPVVSCCYGYLYNKKSILRMLLGQLTTKVPSIKRIRDVVELKRNFVHSKWVDTNGLDILLNNNKTEFAYLAECGHITALDLLKKVDYCPECESSFVHFVVLNARRSESVKNNSLRIKELKEQSKAHNLRQVPNKGLKRSKNEEGIKKVK